MIELPIEKSDVGKSPISVVVPRNLIRGRFAQFVP